jgi:hypothetical protein
VKTPEEEVPMTATVTGDLLADVRQSFGLVLPKIEGLASAQHSRMHGERKDEAIAETVALAWKAYRDLALRGRNTEPLLGKIVEFSAKRVRSGGRLVGMHPVGDVMSPTARFRHDYSVGSLPLSEEPAAPEIVDALSDDGGSPAELAAFRIDLEEWLSRLDQRHRTVAKQLLSGLNTVEVARLHKVTRTMIYHLRCDLLDDWQRFHNEED